MTRRRNCLTFEMNPLPLHEFHHGLGARFAEVNGAEIVNDYGDWLAEHKALRETAGILDLSFRSRICLIGNDRVRFLHGQVTNDVKKLHAGEGCYAAITTAKGKMESDLNIFNLADELLLDFEPGLTEKISARLEKFIVADDVQIVDAAPHYGLLSVQGPKAGSRCSQFGLFAEIPAKQFDSVKISDATLGEIYLTNHARLNLRSSGHESAHSDALESQSRLTSAATDKMIFGFDLFVPNNSLGAVADKLIAAAKQIGGRAAGWHGVRDRAHRGGHSAVRRGHGRDEHSARMRHREPRHEFTTKAATSGRKSSTASTASATSTANCAACASQMICHPCPQRGDKLFSTRQGNWLCHQRRKISGAQCQHRARLRPPRSQSNRHRTEVANSSG